MLPKLSADFSHDEWRVIHERRRGWEKATPDLLANVFGTTPGGHQSYRPQNGHIGKGARVMTMWRAGRLAVCVDASAPKYLADIDDLENSSPVNLDYRATYRVLKVMTDKGYVGLKVRDENRAWLASRFRPLIDQADDAALIARIKNCTPTAADPGDVNA